ncbi:MAG: TRAP transporter permease, partial [Rubrivivax sp.]|nr:TRAP transporter permease [Rubrivivax sp.]
MFGKKKNAAEIDAKALAEESDTGGRKPGPLVGRLLLVVCLAWSLFQLWIASPLPFALGFGVFNDTQSRAVHLGFAVFLAYMAYPAFSRSPRNRIPVTDWVFALVGAFCASYLFFFYRELATRPGQPTDQDLLVAIVGVVLLLEATRRALGLPMVIVAVVFLVYTFGGPHMPDLIAHKGASLSRVASHQWLTTEGVFGVALGVSSGFIFLFVLFGSLLDRAGAGNYFIKSAFALLGHMRGGPAKAAVVSSAATGIISGSSIANVVTTGTFTIPLMKRVGYPATKAGAFEVAASVNGQIMPPIMGAAAFLIAEYVGIPYTEVIRHAFLPAIATYISLFYIVHIEALKADIEGLPRATIRPLTARLMRAAFGIAAFLIVANLIYFGVYWIKAAFAGNAPTVVTIAIAVAYVALIAWRSRYPDLEPDDPDAEIVLPDAFTVARTGFHYLLPIVVLVWCLMIEHLSPGLSAFWALVPLIVIILTQDALTALFRGDYGVGRHLAKGLADLLHGLRNGAVNMVGVAIATATAGIIVGTVALTGLGLVMTEVVEILSAGNLYLMLALTAVICLILGMGLPTTANYIVVATLMAPVI